VGRRLGLTAWAQASDAQFTDACNRWSVRLKEKSEECSKLLIEQVMWRWAVREMNPINHWQCMQVQMERKVDNVGLELSVLNVRGAGSGSKKAYN